MKRHLHPSRKALRYSKFFFFQDVSDDIFLKTVCFQVFLAKIFTNACYNASCYKFMPPWCQMITITIRSIVCKQIQGDFFLHKRVIVDYCLQQLFVQCHCLWQRIRIRIKKKTKKLPRLQHANYFIFLNSNRVSVVHEMLRSFTQCLYPCCLQM